MRELNDRMRFKPIKSNICKHIENNKYKIYYKFESNK